MFLELSSIYQMDCVVSLSRVETNQLLKHLQSLLPGFSSSSILALLENNTFSFLTLNICLTFCRGRFTFSLCISWSTSLILKLPSPFLSASSNVCFNHIEQELRNSTEYQGILLNIMYIWCFFMLGKTVYKAGDERKFKVIYDCTMLFQ